MGKTLYNGIELPGVWPPRDRKLGADPPPTPPYLISPPRVIPIDVGRQLFVDDFLIEQTTLKRDFHSAEYHPDNPVLKPDKPWEATRHPDLPKWRESWSAPMACPFSDGVWYDPADKLFKMWYMNGYCDATCYAISEDGINWEKPALDVDPPTNRVYTTVSASRTVWLDLEETDPARRYKMFYHKWPQLGEELQVAFSSDGIHWTDVLKDGGINGDRTTVFYNPFRKVWVFSIRWGGIIEEGQTGVRTRNYWEHPDALEGAQWKEDDPVFWIGADRLDPPYPDRDLKFSELYNLDCVAYESLIIGLFAILQGHETGSPKLNELKVGFTRDGFNWDRTSREIFIPMDPTPGAWNRGNIQSAGGCCLVVGDKLHFYVSGKLGEPGGYDSIGRASTGLAILRRDGFASMDAGESEGALTTKPVSFSGKHLFVNVDAPKGELRVEVLDENGQVIAPFTRENCVPISADKTFQGVSWNGADSLAALSGTPVRFKFFLKNGKLYSFWVSPDKSGASHGYVAAGGPGFTGPTDTVGACS